MSNEPPMDPGMPEKYPYAFASVMPSVYLRPFKQVIYDTEVLPCKDTPHTLAFMQMQLGQHTQYGQGIIKTLAMTNLTQPGQLANPLEFSLFGFQLFMFDDRGEIVDRRERGRVLGKATFSFLYTGNRIYLELPAFLIPSDGTPLTPKDQINLKPRDAKFVKKSDGEVAALEKENREEYEKYLKEFQENAERDAAERAYNFTIGRSALRIRPTESFGFRLEWPERAPELERDLRIMVVMRGLLWTPM